MESHETKNHVHNKSGVKGSLLNGRISENQVSDKGLVSSVYKERVNLITKQSDFIFIFYTLFFLILFMERHFKYSIVYVSVPNSRSLPLHHPSLLVTISLFSGSLSVCSFVSFVLDSRFKQYHMTFV